MINPGSSTRQRALDDLRWEAKEFKPVDPTAVDRARQFLEEVPDSAFGRWSLVNDDVLTDYPMIEIGSSGSVQIMWEKGLRLLQLTFPAYDKYHVVYHKETRIKNYYQGGDLSRNSKAKLASLIYWVMGG